MYIPRFLGSTTGNTTYHIYGRVTRLIQLCNYVFNMLCRLYDVTYSNNDVKNHIGLVHFDFSTLYYTKESITMFCLKCLTTILRI